MQRYESGSPRALIGIFAVAMTAATLALAVLAPAATEYRARDIGVLAGGDIATYDATPITSIDVVAVRAVRHVPVVEARRTHPDANLQG